MQNVLGFIMYLALLSNLSPIVMMLVGAATIIGFGINKRVASWGFAHREEESQKAHRINYLGELGLKRKLGKDIRIFGLHPWIEDLRTQANEIWRAYLFKREMTYLWINVTNVLVTFLRNALTYAYLLNLAIGGELSASAFLLYFGAIGGFAEWIQGILDQAILLRQ